MKIYALAVILFITLFSCSSEQDLLNKTRVFNSDVAASLKEFNKEFNSNRTELYFASGIKVSNCGAYEKAMMTSKVSEGVNNQLIKSEYLLCDSLILLGNRPYSVIPYDMKLSDVLANKLDLRSFPSSLRPRLDDTNYTLEKIAGNKLVIKDNKVVYETEDWFYGVELIAISDVNSNQKDDWILWFIDESKVGNYRGYQTLVLYDVNVSKSVVSAQIYPNL